MLSIVALLAVRAQDPSSLDDLLKLRDFQSKRVSSENADGKHDNVDFKAVRPGETLTLADATGPGTIRRIWLTILPSEPEYSRLMTLRIYWDGEKSPSVECPLGDFFGVGQGADQDFESIPVRASAGGRARTCIWPMPFRKAARITVTNEGSEATWCFYYAVNWEQGSVATDAPYFHASYRQAFPCKPGNYVVADIQGNGQYVGTVLSVKATSPGWWGEGNDYFYIDGEATPSLRGTGFEDYFNEAWGLRKVSSAYSGCSLYEDSDSSSQATAYRWHIPDPVRFRHSLRVEFQHRGVAFDAYGNDLGNNNERPDEYSSVAIWYQQGPHKPYPPLPVGFDRLSFDYRHLIQAEDKFSSMKATGGDLNVVKANGLSKGAEVEWSNVKLGATLDIPFQVPTDGQYQLMLLSTFRDDGGTAGISVDGARVLRGVSWVADGFDPYHEVSTEWLHLQKGNHTARLTAAKAGWFGIDGYILQKTPR